MPRGRGAGKRRGAPRGIGRGVAQGRGTKGKVTLVTPAGMAKLIDLRINLTRDCLNLPGSPVTPAGREPLPPPKPTAVSPGRGRGVTVSGVGPAGGDPLPPRDPAAVCPVAPREREATPGIVSGPLPAPDQAAIPPLAKLEG
jgi:hypothetical protein